MFIRTSGPELKNSTLVCPFRLINSKDASGTMQLSGASEPCWIGSPNCLHPKEARIKLRGCMGNIHVSPGLYAKTGEFSLSPQSPLSHPLGNVKGHPDWTIKLGGIHVHQPLARRVYLLKAQSAGKQKGNCHSLAPAFWEASEFSLFCS